MKYYYLLRMIDIVQNLHFENFAATNTKEDGKELKMATHSLFHSEDTLDVPALPLGDHLAHGLVLLHLVLLEPEQRS